MKRRILSIFCALALCLSLLPATALANGPDSSITDIPEGLEIEGTVVTGYEGTATEIVIPEGVTEIGYEAFLDSMVQEVKLPSTLTTIGEKAFERSTLTSITIPASVTTIGKYAFSNTKDLVSATIRGDPALGDGAFWKSGIQSIEMDQVTAISYLCFASSALSSISMASVTSIGESAFTNTKLTEFTVPDTVESIDRYFLDDIEDLATLTVSLATLQKTGIHENAFANISSGCNVVLTGVNADITLLDDGFSVGDETYTFLRFSINTVQEPSNCTITNQTGEDVSVVVDGETITLADGNIKPVGSVANGDAYLTDLTVTAGSSALVLTPSFTNPETAYTAQVDNETASVLVTAQPSNSAASVSINGQAADADNSYTVDVELAVGENLISIEVTAPDGTTQKTYTVTVTRNEAVPQHLTISTADELMDFADKVNNGPYQGKVTADMLVELTADIDMSGYTWTPIDFVDDLLFFGTFDGNDHTISGLTIYNVGDAANFGLFGSTACTIRDVHVSGEFFDKADGSSNYWFGSIAGYTEGNVIGCTADFTVHGEDGKLRGQVIGGVVGYIYHAPDDTPLTMENCVSYTTITGTVGAGFVGGVAGVIANTETINCRNYGTLSISQTGYVYAGGITGQTQTGAVLDHCINYGDITHTTANNMSLIGGICGRVSTASQLICCTNNGDLDTQADSSGGIVGATYYGDYDTAVAITQCLNNGAVSSTYSSANVAGLIAAIGSDSYVEVTANISLGQLSAESTSSIIHPVVAKVSTSSTVTISSNYYDSSLTTQGNIAQAVTDGSTGKPLTELETEAFIEQVNAEGGNFRLDEDGHIEVIPLSYTLTVVDSYADDSGAGAYEEGELVTIDAGSRPGYRFTGWTATSGDIADPTVSQTTFIMPDEAAAVTASWAAIPVSIPTYSIHLDIGDHGIVHASYSTAAAGMTITLTVTPDEGYELASLTITKSNGDEVQFTDNGSGKITFTMPASNVKVTAVFRAAYDVCPRDETCPIWPFTDASTTAWYHDGVHYCLANGLMEGVDNVLFAPDAGMTRAMVWAILARLDGETITGSNWAETARAWAMAEGVSDGTDPMGAVTREQLVTMLWRYAGSETPTGSLTRYPDYASISDWAGQAMLWATVEGIIEGDENGLINPTATATRAQAATMLMRFCEG